jgi:hypothetical protein
MAIKKKKTKRTTRAKAKAPKRAAKKKSVARAKPARRAVRKPARKAARRAAPKRARASSAAAPKKKNKKAAAATAIRRNDHAGHLDPKYARELRARGGKPEPVGRAFIVEPRGNDDLAEELAEEAIESATSGEYDGEDRMNQAVAEETGGPFVESTGKVEFAHGTDLSNPKGAKKEPFPTT